MAQKRRNYKKLVWWGAGLILIVAIVTGVVVAVNNTGKTNEQGVESNEKVEQKDEIEKSESTENSSKDEETAKQQKVVQYTGDDPNSLDELTGVVSYAGVNGQALMIRVNIDQYLTEGTCELTLTRGGSIIYSDTAAIVGSASTATCQGFDILTSELGEGNVEININVTADGKRGTIRGEANI